MKFIIQADEQLDIIEMIFSRYLQLPTNLLFLKNNRLPLIGNEKHIALKRFPEHYFSNKPWHPFLCIGCVIDVLEIMLYSDSIYSNELISNPLLDNGGKPYISSYRLGADLKQLIYNHILNNDYVKQNEVNVPIVSKEIDIILRNITTIYKSMLPITYQYPDSVYDFDISTGNIIVSRVGHILELRYLETLDSKRGQRG